MTNLSNTIRRVHGYEKGAYTYYPILIVGAGESGIAAGCRLKQALGFDQFRIFDRQSGIGGTWWINRYPNVACDVPAIFYSFSFSPNPKWSTIYPSGAEILEYLHGVCDKFQINDKIQVNTDVTEMRWLEEEELWEVVLTHMAPGTGDMSRRERQDLVDENGPQSVYLRQETVRAKIVLSGAGAFVEPNAWPASIPGQGEFEGRIFHSGRWKEDIDLVGKDVVVVGTGCSAAQFVPALTKAPYSAKSVTQIMRSPPWVLPQIVSPNARRKWEEWAPFLFEYIPGLARFCRFLVFCLSELDFFTYFRDSPRTIRQRKKLEEKLIQHMKKSVPKKYHEILTPDYTVICKRRIFDDDWFSALNDPQVELTTQPLTSLQPRGITLGPGRTFPKDQEAGSKAPIDVVQLPADVIILANGYEITTWLHPMKVRGRGGVLMQDVWDERGGAQAYMGAAMDGFPNFFLIFGPNTATGHSSVILASENMVNYSLHFIKKILVGDVKTVEVKKTAEIAWTKEMQDQLKQTVVGSGGCRSWYKTSSGWNSTAYPYSQIDYSLRCMFPKWNDWDLKYTPKGLAKKRIGRIIQYLSLIGFIIFLYASQKKTEVLRNWASAWRNGVVEIFRRGYAFGKHALE